MNNSYFERLKLNSTQRNFDIAVVIATSASEAPGAAHACFHAVQYTEENHLHTAIAPLFCRYTYKGGEQNTSLL
jgi:hypothetical protein